MADKQSEKDLSEKPGMSRRTFMTKALPGIIGALAGGTLLSETVVSRLLELGNGHETPTIDDLSDDLFNYNTDAFDRYGAVITLSIARAVTEKRDKTPALASRRVSIYYAYGGQPKQLNIIFDSNGMQSGLNDLNTGGYKVKTPQETVSLLASIGNIMQIGISSGDKLPIKGEDIPDSVKKLLPKDYDFEKIAECTRDREIHIDFTGGDKVAKTKHDLYTFSTTNPNGGVIGFTFGLNSEKVLPKNSDKWVFSDSKVNLFPPMAFGSPVSIKNDLVDVVGGLKTVDKWFSK